MTRRRRQSQPPVDENAAFSRMSAAGLILLGLIIGLVGALYYAWVVSPIVYTEVGPSRMSDKYKQEYIYLVSQSYAANGDWVQTENRLEALEDPALNETVAALLEAYLREQQDPLVIQNLARLAQGLGVEDKAVALFAPTPAGPMPTDTPTPAASLAETAVPTITVTPSLTPEPSTTPTSSPEPSPTARPNYRLLMQEPYCEKGEAISLLVVETQDALLNQLPGVEVLVTWEGGEDHFFTGFKPALGAGYGDFKMEPGVSYTIQLADGSPEISGLRIEPCADGADGGWWLTFQNLRLRLTATPEP
ncbi:MAG: hypothetical protein IAF02_18910 [Anaerolineae bacterium]|nr:hypothetical protein [Anaerolineae bacterium]